MRLSSFLTLGLALTSLVTTPMVSADFRDFLSHPAASALPDPDITTSSITSPSAPTSSDIISQVVSHITTEEKKPKYGRKHKGIKKNPHHPSLPHLKLLLASPSSSSSSSNTGPVDELLNEDSDTLAAQENLDVGAMSSAGLDVTPSSSSSSAPPPPKVPAMAAAIMTQAIKKHTKHGHTHQHTPVSPEYRRHQPIMGTPVESIPSTSEQTQSIPSQHIQSIPISSSHVQSIPVSPFVRLTIATGRVNNAMEQLFADLRASLRAHDVMSQSMWRTSMSRPYTSNIMRIFPVGHDANVYISHAHTESSNERHTCRADAQRLCSDIHGMIPTMACLSQHINQVSSECVNQIKTCSIMSCAHDIMQYCTSEQQISRAGIMECLAASHDKLSEQCRATQQHDTPVTSAAVTSTSTSTSADAIITPLSVVGIPPSPSSASTSTTTLIISLSIVATVLLSLSIFLYMYLRRMSHEQEDVKLNVIQHSEMESETL